MTEVAHEPTASARHATGGLVRDTVLVLGMFAVGAALGALLWRWAWSPFRGTVLGGVWYPDTNASAFSSTGLFVTIGLGVGLVLGVLSALLTDRRELLTLGLVLVSSLAAGWLMWRLARIGMPADPTVLARTAADRSRLPATLSVDGLSPFAAFPTGGLLGLCIVFMGITRRGDQGRSPAGTHRDDAPSQR